MEIQNDNGTLTLKEGDQIIEEYCLNSEINFEGLMKFLLNKNLDEKIEFNLKKEDFNEQQNVLIGIIKDIVCEFNEKVYEFNKFKETHCSE